MDVKRNLEKRQSINRRFYHKKLQKNTQNYSQICNRENRKQKKKKYFINEVIYLFEVWYFTKPMIGS